MDGNAHTHDAPEAAVASCCSSSKDETARPLESSCCHTATPSCHSTPSSCHGGDTATDHHFERRAWIAALFAIPLIFLVMGVHAFGLPIGKVMSPAAFQWLQFGLTMPIMIWCAKPIFTLGWTSIVQKTPNMWTLIVVGVTAAFGYSVIALLWPSLFPAELQSESGRVPVYFEAAAAIVLLVLIGQVLETRAGTKAANAIRSLLDLSPQTVTVLDEDGHETSAPAGDIVPGQKLVIKPGGAIPVDGTVVQGESDIDEQLLSGEPLPVSKVVGDPIFSGTLNTTGRLIVEATRTGADTTLSKIIELVERAQNSRAPIQNLADRVAKWFVPAVLVFALLAAVAWLIFGPQPTLSYALVAAVSVLLIACPCALGLATPMSLMVASGTGARNGILIKDAGALQSLAEVDTIIFDKTGTLTIGKPDVVGITPAQGQTEDDVLRLAASLEQASEHPLAQAIVREAQSRGLSLAEVSHFKAVVGAGVEGRIDGQSVVVGSQGLMAERGIKVPNIALEHAGATGLYVTQDQDFLGHIEMSDSLREDARDAIHELRKRNLHVAIASGDSQDATDHVAKSLGIARAFGGLRPDDKASLISKLQHQGQTVAFAGDGLNDAPALATADVGIAMGAGADVAIETAGIILRGDDIQAVVRAHALAGRTLTNIKQNLTFAFGYNALGIPIAAGVLYPVFGLLLSPIFAAAAMSLSSVSVITNALRLGRS